MLKAAGRAPITPTRTFLSPFTIRQVAANDFRSDLKASEEGATVCSRGERVTDAVLPQVVAHRNLSAEAVAPPAHQHLVGLVGKSMHQHRHIEPRHADRVGHAALVAEVGQADQNAVDLVAVLLEQVGAPTRVLQGFDRAELGLFGGQAHRPVALLLQQAQDFYAAVARQHGGEKTTITDDYSKTGCGHGGSSHLRIAGISPGQRR